MAPLEYMDSQFLARKARFGKIKSIPEINSGFGNVIGKSEGYKKSRGALPN
jgi:hypothetical protein